MIATQDISTFTVDRENNARIICPECGLERIINVAGFRYSRDNFTFRCQCGSQFRGNFDFRSGWVRRVELEGEYFNPRSDDSDRMRVQLLSMDGLNFRTLARHDIEHGDLINLTFRLDNVLGTEIRRQARVTSVSAAGIEAEFHNRPPYDPDLGFYLMP